MSNLETQVSVKVTADTRAFRDITNESKKTVRKIARFEEEFEHSRLNALGKFLVTKEKQEQKAARGRQANAKKQAKLEHDIESSLSGQVTRQHKEDERYRKERKRAADKEKRDQHKRNRASVSDQRYNKAEARRDRSEDIRERKFVALEEHRGNQLEVSHKKVAVSQEKVAISLRREDRLQSAEERKKEASHERNQAKAEKKRLKDKIKWRSLGAKLAMPLTEMGDPLRPLSSAAPGVGALAGAAVGLGGSVAGRGLQALSAVPVFGGLFSGAGDVMRVAAEALAPAAEAIVSETFVRAQATFDQFARHEQAVAAAFPHTRRPSRTSQVEREGIADVYGYNSVQMSGIMNQLSGAAGFDPFTQSVSVNREFQISPEAAIAEALISGQSMEAIGAMMSIYGPGGGGGGPSRAHGMNAPSYLMSRFSDMGAARGYLPQTLNPMAGRFAGMVGQMGARGIDLPGFETGGPGSVGALQGDLFSMTGLAGLEGGRASAFQEGMINSAYGASRGQGSDLTRYMWLAAASEAGAGGWRESMEMLESGQITSGQMLDQVRRTGPNADIILRNMDVGVGSLQQAQEILSGRVAEGQGSGNIPGGFSGSMIARTRRIQSGAEVRQAGIGEQHIDSAQDLSSAFLVLDEASARLVKSFEGLVLMMPSVIETIIPLTEQGSRYLD